MRLTQTGLNSYQSRASFETRLLDPVSHSNRLQGYQSIDNYDTATVNFYFNGGWEMALNERINQVLTDIY